MQAIKYFMFFLLMFWGTTSFAADYYVAPNGGTGAGNINDPWSLAHANGQLKAGDKAILRGGIYSGQVIKPVNSGTSGSHIAYVAYTGETPEFRGGSTRIPILIDLTDRSYITVDGISADGEGVFDDSKFNEWVKFSNTKYCVIKNSTFRRARGWSAFRFEWSSNSEYNKILNNVVDTVGTWDVYQWKGEHDDSGSAFYLTNNSHNLIEGNVFSRCGHDVGQVDGGEFNVIRKNVFDNDWGTYNGTAFQFKAGSIAPGDRVGNRTLEIKKGKYNLVEQNVFKNVGESVDNQNVGMMKVHGEYQVVRNNYYLNGNSSGVWIGVVGGAHPVANYNKIYHNVFYNLGGPAWMIDQQDDTIAPATFNVFKNNVIYKTHTKPTSSRYDAEISFNGVLRAPLSNGDVYQNNVASYNCIASDLSKGNQKVYSDATGGIALSTMEANSGSYFNNNKEEVPSFVSATPQVPADFQLASNSACRNAGGNLTVATNSGSGTTFAVADASYFSDGNGLIEGDLIKVGSNPAVRITSINRSTNTITVSSSISWGINAGVNINYTGTKPDAGVAVYDASVLTQIALDPPQGITLIRLQ